MTNLSLLSCSLLVLASSLSAVETTIDYTARLSVGIAKGIGLNEDDATHPKIDVTNGNILAAYIYELDPGVNLETPVLFNFRREGSVYVIAAPALVYSKNKTDTKYYLINTNLGTEDTHIKDTYTQIGGKLYFGVGFGKKIGWHGELLPYVGYSRLENEKKIERSNAAGSSEKNSGSLFSYGITAGSYYTPEFAPYLEIGGRLGFVGGQGKVGENDVDQRGALFAFEIGTHF
jgi:hypothetical protein